MQLSATNLEVATTTWVSAMIEEEGAITLDAKVFSDFVGSLGDSRIDVDMDSESQQVSIKSGRSRATLRGVDASNFPPIPTLDDATVMHVNRQVFKNAISRVVMAAADEISRPVLTGVNVKIKDSGDFILAAADGFRLAVQTSKIEEPPSSEMDVIIPAKTMSELQRLAVGGDNVDMMMSSHGKQVLFRLDNGTDKVEMVSQLIEGSFPNFEQLIPQSYNTKCMFNQKEMNQRVKTSSIFARDGSNIIRVSMDRENEEASQGESDAAGFLKIAARSEEVGDSDDYVDLSNVEGDDFKIAFNSTYLADMLRAMDADRISMEVSGSSSPGVFKLADSDEYVHVIMPMFVQW